MKTSNIPILTKVKNHKKDKHLTTDFMLQIEINNELTACRDHIGKQRPIQKMTATLCKASITVVLIFLGSRFLKLGHRESKKKKTSPLSILVISQLYSQTCRAHGTAHLEPSFWQQVLFYPDVLPFFLNLPREVSHRK